MLKTIFMFLMGLGLYTPSVLANVIGHDVQNFNPLTSGLDFVSVHSSETLQPCVINCGVFLDYATNSLPNFDVGLANGADLNEHEDSLFSSDVNIGVGLTRRWDLGVSISSVLSQTVDSQIQGVEYEQTGLTDIRVNTKYRFLGGLNGGLALILGASFNQTKNNPYTGIDAGPTINIQLAADTTVSEKVALAINLGYRLRDPGEPIALIDLCPPGSACAGSAEIITPFGDNIIGSLAANYLIEDWETKIIGEIYGSIPVDEAANSSKRTQTTAELVLGAKKDFTDKFSAHLGGGLGLLNGSASPDFRIYTGLNYALGPLGFCRNSEKPVIAKVEEGQDPAEAILIAEDAPEPLAPEPVLDVSDIEPVDQEPIADDTPDEEVFVIRDVLFDTDKYYLKDEADSTIQDVASKLMRPGGFQWVKVEGHTDSRDTVAYNQKLSERRAKAVRARLIKLGVPGDKLEAIGKGELEPIADNGNYQGRALNRRVEFRVRWR